MSIVDWTNEPDENALIVAIRLKETDPAGAQLVFGTLAERGSPTAMFYLGEIFARGLTGTTDYVVAENWYIKAAKSGALLAWYSLGILYHATSRFSQAKEAFEIASAHSYPPALNQLGRYYASGVGTEIDIAKAKKCLERASAKGHVMALGALGVLLRKYPENTSENLRGVWLYFVAAFKLYFYAFKEGLESERLR